MTNAASAAGDRYYVYRPILDLLGMSEGTDKGRGYNETLAYGAYTGGPVDLVGMTLKQIDDLQGKMLAHPKNKWKSSALGRYQIVRTTRRNIQKALSIPSSAKFDAEMQDRMACFLLGQRGIDKWLAGRLKIDTMLDNLAREWASLPTSKGKGYYSGQNASVSVSQVKFALAEVARRHNQAQPKIEVERPVVPDEVEKEVQKKTGLWGWITSILGGGGAGLAGLLGADWQTVLAIGGVALVMLLMVILLRRQIVAALQEIREGLA